MSILKKKNSKLRNQMIRQFKKKQMKMRTCVARRSKPEQQMIPEA